MKKAKKKKAAKPYIDYFDFPAGRKIAGKYEIVAPLGKGWEGEVYKIRELTTGIERAAKIFYPDRNPKNRVSKWYAKKLHKLRHCPVVIQYQTQEIVTIRKLPVTVLVSEYVDGVILKQFLRSQPGRRLTPFEGIHLLHEMATGIEAIHHLREYHGDLHPENVIVRRHGLGFNVKLLDMFHWQAPRQENIQDDVCDMVRIFYDAVGGAKHYPRQPAVVKDICNGLKRSLILAKFRTAGQLRKYLENLEWE